MSTTATPVPKRSQLAFLHEQIEEMKTKGLHFRLRILEGEQKPVAQFDGKEVINLSSNNYLGLTTHKALRRAALDATKKWGAGAVGKNRTGGNALLRRAATEGKNRTGKSAGATRRNQPPFFNSANTRRATSLRVSKTPWP
jgi:glycine C-acetyltransferase